jgi:hypothetical protein
MMMQFGNYSPTAADKAPFTGSDRYLFEFANGYQASVIKTAEGEIENWAEHYPSGADAVGTYELCVLTEGVPVWFGDLTDPLGDAPNSQGVHVELSEAEVTAMLSRLEAADAANAA